MAASDRPRRGEVELVAALAAGAPMTEAARAAGVSERTAYRWTAEPELRRQVIDARTAMLDATAGRLAHATTHAVATLEELLAPGVQDSVRLAAARALLERATAAHEATAWEERLDALENAADAAARLRLVQ